MAFCSIIIVVLVLLMLKFGIKILIHTFTVLSRKNYKCSNCGLECKTEHMDAMFCQSCGAPLKEEIKEK